MSGFSSSSVGGVTAVMMVVEIVQQGLSTLSKAALTTGMSSFVFVVYSNSLAVFILLPTSLCFHRKRPLPEIRPSIISRIFLLGLLECFMQLLKYIGLGYSSPTLASAMNNLVPGITFVLAIILRMERIDLRAVSSVAKFTGTLISIVGALTITLFKGLPLIDNGSKTIQELLLPWSGWITGAMFLALAAFVLSLLYIVRTWIIRDYPAELVVGLGSCIFTAINAIAFALFLERDPKAWSLKHGRIELITIGYAAIFGGVIRNVAHIWACRMKGPLFVSMFKPLGMVFAIVMGVSFLKDTLYLGSVIGAMIIAVGFYAVVWGKAEDEKVDAECGPICGSNDQTPLLNAKLEI